MTLSQYLIGPGFVPQCSPEQRAAGAKTRKHAVGSHLAPPQASIVGRYRYPSMCSGSRYPAGGASKNCDQPCPRPNPRRTKSIVSDELTSSDSRVIFHKGLADLLAFGRACKRSITLIVERLDTAGEKTLDSRAFRCALGPFPTGAAS